MGSRSRSLIETIVPYISSDFAFVDRDNIST